MTCTVTDTGIGMSQETIARLYKPFSQADNSWSRRFGGSGLGLSITKLLVELMGGTITVTSEINRGCQFQFQMELKSVTDFTRESVHGECKSCKPTSLPPDIRVLVAEDNPVNQLVLTKVLQRSGCLFIGLASTGKEAIAELQREEFDVILMDGEMPDMDGLDATRYIRQYVNKEVVIIGVTAHAMPSDKESFLNAGMNGYLTKPIQKESLVREIMNCLSCSKK